MLANSSGLAVEIEEEGRARLENDGPTKRLSLVVEDGRRKKTKTRDGSYRTGHVIPDKRCGLCERGFVC